MPRQSKKTKAPHLGLFPDLVDSQSTGGAVSAAQQTESVEKRSRTASVFTTTKDLLSRYQVITTNKHIAHEFQSFGCYLAETLADKPHTALYIKLAKQLPRAVLEQALRFVIDSTADNKAKLFMWKLEQIKQGKKAT